MTVVVLDPRWPDMIPAAAFVDAALRLPMDAAPGVPEAALRVMRALATEAGGPGSPPQVAAAAAGTWVTCDPVDPEAIRRRQAGEPVILAPSLADPVRKAVAVMHAARTRGEWEAGQTHASLVPFLIEEAGECAEAAWRWSPGAPGADAELVAELSDVLLQVLFHAEIASERGAFTLDDVASRFVAKMRSRAPYLFDGFSGRVSADEQDRLWALGKRRERENPSR